MKINTMDKISTDVKLSTSNWIGIKILNHSLVLLGRVFFSFLFIITSFGHFEQSAIDMAVNKNIPMAESFVLISGLMALIGGFSLMLGIFTKMGSLLLMIFLIPITFYMHNFWAMSDVVEIQNQQVQFFKNLALLGGTIHYYYFGPGKYSFDHYFDHASKRIQ